MRSLPPVVSPDCNDVEREQLRRHTCPDCDHTQFRRGPSGGLAVNIECTNCRARFNVTMIAGVGIKRIPFAHRIERFDQGGSEWPDRGLW
jgi:ribosomal protein L37AE/L43A